MGHRRFRRRLWRHRARSPGSLRQCRFNARHHLDRRHQVIDEAWIHRSSIFIEDYLFAQRLTDAHRGGAFDLTFGGHAMNRLADVVHRDVFQNFHVAGIGAYFDDAGVGRERLGAAVGFFFGHQCQVVAVPRPITSPITLCASVATVASGIDFVGVPLTRICLSTISKSSGLASSLLAAVLNRMIGICFFDLDANNSNPAPSAACEPAVNSSIASRTKKSSFH